MEALLLLLMAAAFAIAWWLALNQLAYWNSQRFEPSFEQLYATRMMALPALFLGLISSGLMVTTLNRMLLAVRYPLYIRYQNLTMRYDFDRATRPVVVFTVAASLLLAAPMLNWRIVFNPNDVEFHSPFLLSTSVEHYADVVDIRTAPRFRTPNAKMVDGQEYQIEFRDGTVLATKEIMADCGLPRKQRLAQFISDRSKKPIRVLGFLE